MSTITNPLTRHPSVMANALATMAELAPGRVACGIGTGDSAMWMIGEPPAKIAYLREYVLALRGLLRGEEVEFQGKRFRAEWVGFEPLEHPPPIYVAAAGPKVLRMGAEVADGLVVNLGFSPELIELARQTVAEGAAAAGRTVADLDVFWQTTINFGESAQAARDRSLGIFTSWMTKGSLEGKMIPEELKAPLVQFNHDIEQASRYSDGGRDMTLVERAKKMGLYDWLSTLAPGFFGTSKDIARRLEEFSAQDMTRWVFYVGPFLGDPTRFTRRFTDEVMPALDQLHTGAP